MQKDKTARKARKNVRRVVLGEGRLWTNGTRYGVELHPSHCHPNTCANSRLPLYPNKANGCVVRLVAEVLE